MAKTKEDEKVVVKDKAESTIVVDSKPTEQAKKELAFRLLWQSSRLVRGATLKELLAAMPAMREWVGVERSEALEKQWRGGRPA